ncbi:MAG: hypothetical protein LBW85_10735 [Deltaproteobacteria bacterium]|jgi:hypothetical protein|nr:hypothetical protein [Deltaproteobacteria bacterium]
MIFRAGFLALSRRAFVLVLACAAPLLSFAACSPPERAIPPEERSGIAHVAVSVGRTTREEMIDALGQPAEASREGDRETLAWTNDRGFMLAFSGDGEPPAVSRFQSRIAVRIAGGVVTGVEAR